MSKFIAGMLFSVVLVSGGAIGGVSVGMQTQKTVQSIPFVGAWVK